MKGRSLAALALAAALTLTLASPALAADAVDRFPAVNAYSGYPDVAESDWFYDNAKLCYEIGVITGTQNGFEAERAVTGGECLAMAARLLEGFTGKAIPANEPGAGKWYQNYLDYVSQAQVEDGSSVYGLIDWSKVEAPATRREFVLYLLVVLSAAGDHLSLVNSISAQALPDLGNDDYALPFYNYGIMTGTDEYGTFAADKTLTRAEAAAMVSRIVRPELRKTFIPKPVEVSPSQTQDASQTGAASDGVLTASQFARVYLGNDADKVYLWAGELELPAVEFLRQAMTISLPLLRAAQSQGIQFSWELPIGSNDGTTCAQYTFTKAIFGGLQEQWNKLHAPDDAAVAAWADTVELWRAKHILVKDRSTADMLYDTLQSHPDQFDQLETVYTEDPGAASNPDGYFFGPGEMVTEFEEATKATPPGSISSPVQSQFGWHIIQRLPLTRDDYLDTTFADYMNALQDDQVIVNETDFPKGINFTEVLSLWLQSAQEASS